MVVLAGGKRRAIGGVAATMFVNTKWLMSHSTAWSARAAVLRSGLGIQVLLKSCLGVSSWTS